VPRSFPSENYSKLKVAGEGDEKPAQKAAVKLKYLVLCCVTYIIKSLLIFKSML
jgi:hypothetical protein